MSSGGLSEHPWKIPRQVQIIYSSDYRFGHIMPILVSGPVEAALSSRPSHLFGPRARPPELEGHCLLWVVFFLIKPPLSGLPWAAPDHNPGDKICMVNSVLKRKWAQRVHESSSEKQFEKRCKRVIFKKHLWPTCRAYGQHHCETTTISWLRPHQMPSSG